MPVRGQRSIWPKSPRKPTGIFSAKGSQKMDPNNSPEKPLMSYAHGNSNDANGHSRKTKLPTGGGGLRHLKPKGKK